MRLQRCTFTFYKFLSFILIMVLSVSTVISLTKNNINTVEAASVETREIELKPMSSPLYLRSLNRVVLANDNQVLTSKTEISEASLKTEETDTESVTEIIEQTEVEVEQQNIEVAKEPVKEVTSAQIAGTFTEYEIYEWAKIVYCEASGESQQCKEYVAQVILNRINSDRFPNTVHDVIFQGRQFSPTFDGSWARKEPNQACYDAVYTVLNSPTALTNALFFEACRGSSWHSRNLTEVAAVDNTRFYTY